MEDCLLHGPVLIDQELAHARIVSTSPVASAIANDRLRHTRGRLPARRISPGRHVKKLCEGIDVNQTSLPDVCDTLRAWATERGTG